MINESDGKEALVDLLITRVISHAFLSDQSYNLNCLFTSPKSTKNIDRSLYANQFFLIGRTYKTNRYEMPFLHGISVTLTKETSTLLYRFLNSETVQLYF